MEYPPPEENKEKEEKLNKDKQFFKSRLGFIFTLKRAISRKNQMNSAIIDEIQSRIQSSGNPLLEKFFQPWLDQAILHHQKGIEFRRRIGALENDINVFLKTEPKSVQEVEAQLKTAIDLYERFVGKIGDQGEEVGISGEEEIFDVEAQKIGFPEYVDEFWDNKMSEFDKAKEKEFKDFTDKIDSYGSKLKQYESELKAVKLDKSNPNSKETLEEWKAKCKNLNAIINGIKIFVEGKNADEGLHSDDSVGVKIAKIEIMGFEDELAKSPFKDEKTFKHNLHLVQSPDFKKGSTQEPGALILSHGDKPQPDGAFPSKKAEIKVGTEIKLPTEKPPRSP